MFLLSCILVLLSTGLSTSFVSAYTPLSDDFLREIRAGGDDFDIHTGTLLAPILIPRVPGTPGQTTVQRHFVDFFTTQLPQWSMQWQNSTGKTPATGTRDVPFQNLIFRREPPWTKPGQANYLTLVAHYDSKLTPAGFIGATDSAAPCAILMHVARSIDEHLQRVYDERAAAGETGGSVSQDMGVQIFLLDGEEAFHAWTAEDSLYGARALAEAMERTVNPARSTYRTSIAQIQLFVLLDLLGGVEPRVESYIATTHWAYVALARIETRMRALGLLATKPPANFLPDGDKAMTSDFMGPGRIQDDYMPFLARGVPTLHLIPSPFPPVWHTIRDDGDHLDLPTVQDWSKLMTAFALEWLDITAARV